MQRQHAVVAIGRAGPLPWQALGLKAFDQIGHRQAARASSMSPMGSPPSLICVPFLGLVAGACRRPDRKGADGIAAIAAGAGAVVENEAPGAGGGMRIPRPGTSLSQWIALPFCGG